jgi:ATP-dependent DNA helicase RecG
MKRYTNQELENFLDDLESDLVERKESFKGDISKKARQSICAFANDLPNRNQAGVLFIGVRDDGSPSKLSITEELLLTLSDIYFRHSFQIK